MSDIEASSSSFPDDVTWKRGGWVRQWVDYPTLCIAFAWVGLWMIWPEQPPTDSDRIPLRRALVVAQSYRAGGDPWYKRPDLIAFPSRVSFLPITKDEGGEGMQYSQGSLPPILARQPAERRVDQEPGSVAFAAEAAREFRSDNIPLLHEAWWNAGKLVSASPVAVQLSGGLKGAMPHWSDTDRAVLFTLGSAWEVELSLTIDDYGQPTMVFVEQSCGNPAIDRAVLRTLARPDVWRGALPGSGRILVSYSPGGSNGGDSED